MEGKGEAKPHHLHIGDIRAIKLGQSDCGGVDKSWHREQDGLEQVGRIKCAVQSHIEGQRVRPSKANCSPSLHKVQRSCND